MNLGIERYLGRLPSPFNRSAAPQAVLHVTDAAGGGHLRVKDWTLSLIPGENSAAQRLTIDLTAQTLTGVATLLNGAGYRTSPIQGNLGAVSAAILAEMDVPFQGDAYLSIATSVLWRIIMPGLLLLKDRQTAYAKGFAELDLRTADGRWLDRWGDLYGASNAADLTPALHRFLIDFHVNQPHTTVTSLNTLTNTLSGVTTQVVDGDAFRWFRATDTASRAAADGDLYARVSAPGPNPTITLFATQPLPSDLYPFPHTDELGAGGWFRAGDLNSRSWDGAAIEQTTVAPPDFPHAWQGVVPDPRFLKIAPQKATRDLALWLGRYKAAGVDQILVVPQVETTLQTHLETHVVLTDTAGAGQSVVPSLGFVARISEVDAVTNVVAPIFPVTRTLVSASVAPSFGLSARVGSGASASFNVISRVQAAVAPTFVNRLRVQKASAPTFTTRTLIKESVAPSFVVNDLAGTNPAPTAMLTTVGAEMNDATRLPVNILANGTFETDLSGWTAQNGATIARSTAQSHSGAASLLCTLSANSSSGAATTGTATVVNQYYSVSLWINRLETAATLTLSLFGNNSTVTIPAVTGWQRIELSGKAWTPTIALTLTGNAAHAGAQFYIDDVTVIQGTASFDTPTPTQGDGKGADSSFGLWQATTNLIANGGFESGTTGWTAASSSIARVTTQSKFGNAALECTTSNLVANEGVSATFAGAAATQYTVSSWVRGASGTVRIALSDSVSGKQASAPVTLTPAWQRITNTATTGAASSGFAVVIETDVQQTVVFDIDGVQTEATAFATPYVETNGAAASRSLATVTTAGGSDRLSATQGWAAVRTRFGGASAATGAWGFFKGTSGSAQLYLHHDSTKWYLQRISSGFGGIASAPPSSYAAGAKATAVAYWTASHLACSNDGVAFTVNADSNIPSITALPLNIGSDIYQSIAADGDILWFACGSGTLTDADAATINSWGDSDPTISQLLALNGGNASPLLVWPAADATYTLIPRRVGAHVDPSFVVRAPVHASTAPTFINRTRVQHVAVTFFSVNYGTVPSDILTLATAPKNGAVALSWAPPATDGGITLSGYTIYQATDTIYTKIGFVPIGTTVFTAGNLTNGTTYHFRVTAVNAAGESPGATHADATPIGPASKPLALVAAPGDSQVTLFWSPPATNGGAAVAQYNIYRNGIYQAFVAPPQGNGIQFTDSQVVNGDTYTYTVAALTAAGIGALSDPAVGVPRSLASRPTNFQAVAVGPGTVALSWFPPANTGGTPVVNYHIVRNGVDFATTSGTGYTDSGLANGAIYNYAIYASNAVGASSSTNTLAVMTPQVPDPPYLVQGNATVNHTIAMSWLAPANTGGLPIDLYLVEFSNGEQLSVTTVQTSKAFFAAGTYSFRVSAHNAVGFSSPSVWVSVVTN